MADEENYSSDEFGFSDEFETDEFDTLDDDSDADQTDTQDDSQGEHQVTSEASDQPYLRYALFAFGLVALSFGGYQLYHTLLPSRPASAVAAMSGSSLISRLESESGSSSAQAEEAVPMSPAKAADTPAAESVTAASLPEPVQPEASASMRNEDKKVAPPEPTLKSTDVVPAERPVIDAQSKPAEPVAPTTVVRYELPKAMINRQNSLESSLRIIQQRLVVLEDTTRAYAEQDSSMSTDLQELNRTLRKLDSKLSNLSSKIEKIATNATTQKTLTDKKLSRLKRSMVTAKPASLAKPKELHYYIQAMIPGRAWLTSKKGATITIRRGSHIIGYGRIMQIDVETGLITTTSGKMIRFHPSER
jgi:intracellular multiplication protein IcmG